jgi:oligopeptide transport system permease protein
MPSNIPLSSTHFVAPFDETPLVAVDKVSIAQRKSNLYIDAWRDVRGRPLFYISGVAILLIIVVALLPRLFTQVDPSYCNLDASNAAPSSGHPLGSTFQGCDIYARIIFGAGTSLSVGFIVTVLVAVVGVVFGAIAGFYGGWLDAVLSRVGDIFFAIPYILAAVVVMSLFTSARNVWTISLAIGLFAWPSTARVLRGQILSVKSSDFVTSATAIGLTRFKILLKHVLPNSIAPIFVITTIGLAGAIVAESTLSFLGVGLGGSTISWGSEISNAQSQLRDNPWTLIFPSIALSVTVLAFILMGEVVRDALDPKARARR